jgi:uncharacterized membrane protein YhaH (DUF805 family)
MLRLTLFGFRGRLTRLAWLGWQVVALLIGLVAGGSGAVLLAAGSRSHFANTELGATALAVATLWLLWTAAALGAKRLHDINRSGWHLVWIYGFAVLPGLLAPLRWEAGALAGLVALVAGLWMALRAGNPGHNRFGVEPVRREEALRRLAARRHHNDRHDPPSLGRPSDEEDFDDDEPCPIPVRIDPRRRF